MLNHVAISRYSNDSPDYAETLIREKRDQVIYSRAVSNMVAHQGVQFEHVRYTIAFNFQCHPATLDLPELNLRKPRSVRPDFIFTI